jgi:acyl-coenzyme A synthetase/AMP-(fatty) acid ligase/acyl carrier protein
MLSLFLTEPTAADCARVLRHVICSGEELPAALAARFHAVLPGVALHNLYGPTEAAIDVTAHRCEPVAAGARVPIGTPIAGARVYILDPAGAPTPIGVPGELFIGGVPVARGYHARPALTASRFVPDPFGHGTRLYRTGDRARFLGDATIEYLGRLDQQVKIRGVRIELGEIEAAILTHPGVTETAVDVRPGPAGEPALVAYVVGEAPDLRRYLLGRLPETMVPGIYLPIAALPLGASGKLNRSALPHVDTPADWAAPSTPVERILAEMWAQVIGVERVGVDDDFFALGGHSLLATRMIARIRETFAVEVPLTELLTGRPTVARLADLIQLRQLSEADADDLATLLHQLDDLTDEQTELLLREHGLNS